MLLSAVEKLECEYRCLQFYAHSLHHRYNVTNLINEKNCGHGNLMALRFHQFPTTARARSSLPFVQILELIYS